jgi:hypothetical protein
MEEDLAWSISTNGRTYVQFLSFVAQLAGLLAGRLDFLFRLTGSPNSRALEPNTLLKIVDVKGADGKAALLLFIVQDIVKPEGHNSLNMIYKCMRTSAYTPTCDL